MHFALSELLATCSSCRTRHRVRTHTRYIFSELRNDTRLSEWSIAVSSGSARARAHCFDKRANRGEVYRRLCETRRWSPIGRAHLPLDDMWAINRREFEKWLQFGTDSPAVRRFYCFNIDCYIHFLRNQTGRIEIDFCFVICTNHFAYAKYMPAPSCNKCWMKNLV